MGGNIRVFKDGVKTVAQQVPLARIGRSSFCNVVRDILFGITDYLACWTHSNIESGEIFNGSSQFVFNPKLSDSDIISVKKTIGDVDVMVDEEHRDYLIKFLETLDVPEFRGFVYNKSIDQVHSVWNILGVNCQIDFEFTKFIDERPSEFSKFSHSASFADAEYGVKAVFHKFLIGAVTYTTSQNILVADSNGRIINDGKQPKFAVFSVVDGFKIKYKPLYDKIRGEFVKRFGLQVFVKNKSPSSTNVKRFYKYLFNVNTLDDYEKFWSFVGTCELIKDNFSRDKVTEIHNKFCEMLQTHRVSKNPTEDRELKYNAYRVFISILDFNDNFKYYEV